MSEPKSPLFPELLVPRRGRPPLPPGQKKSPAQKQKDYRDRHGISSISVTADDILPTVAALQAASACPMLKAEDRATLAKLLQKFGG